MIAGDQFDFAIGPDDLPPHAEQFVRVQVTETYQDPVTGWGLVRFKAVGGGKTNVPRWEAWPTLLYPERTARSLLKTGRLVPVSPTGSGVAMT